MEYNLESQLHMRMKRSCNLESQLHMVMKGVNNLESQLHLRMEEVSTLERQRTRFRKDNVNSVVDDPQRP